MINKIATLLQQSWRDYSFWAVALRSQQVGSWVADITHASPSASRRVVLDSSTTTLRDVPGNIKCGLGLNPPTAQDLDAIWIASQGSRPDTPQRRPFQTYVATTNNTDLVIRAYYAAANLFAMKIDGGRLVYLHNTQAVATVSRSAFICFVYNVTAGFDEDRYYEPNYPDEGFWNGCFSECVPSGAIYGLVLMAQSNPTRWTMMEDSLRELLEQIERESWRVSTFSWTLYNRMMAGNTSLATPIPVVTTIAKALILGGAGLNCFYDIRDCAMRGCSPYEDPIEYLENSRGDNTIRRIEDANAPRILRRATQAYPTPLTQGCLPPQALFHVEYNNSTKEMTANSVSMFDVGKASAGAYVLIDLRLMLKGEHTKIPHRNLAECFAVAMMSLPCSADLFQRAIALNTDAVSLFQGVWTGLVGSFARRDVEYTYSHLGSWWMKDRAPLAHEVGTTEWLFDNDGVTLVPRALTGVTARTTWAAAPARFTVDGVTLQKQQGNTLDVSYRRI